MAREHGAHASNRRRGTALAAAAAAVALVATSAGAAPPPAGTLVSVSKSASAPPVVDGIGGLATCATLPVPVRGIAVSSTNTVYFSDNNRVLKVDGTTGILSVVAGTGVAAFSGDGGSSKVAALSHPAGIWIDPKTGVYVADTGNNRVRRIYNGAISTVAGNGSTAASKPSSKATSANLPAPYRVSTNGTGGLRIGNSAGGAYVNLVTKSFTPTRTHPRAFTVDSALTTYGANPPVAQVRRWLNHATSSTNFAGRGSLHIGYSGDNGNASVATLSASISDLGTDLPGNVFIDDAGNGVVRRVDKATHIITTVTATGGPWAGQLGNGVMFVTPAGDIYASAVGGTQIVRRDHLTGAVTLIAGSGNLHSGCPVPVSTVAVPGTVASITHDGFANTIAVVDLPGAVNPEIWMISTTGVLNKIEANHGAKGSTGDGGPVSAATFTDVTGVDADTPGNIYLNDTGAHRVRRIDHTTHVITTVAGNGTAGSTGDNGPATSAEIQGTLTATSQGDLFIAGDGRIRRVDHTTHVITTVAGGGLTVPTAAGIPADTASISPGLSAIDPAQPGVLHERQQAVPLRPAGAPRHHRHRHVRGRQRGAAHHARRGRRRPGLGRAALGARHRHRGRREHLHHQRQHDPAHRVAHLEDHDHLRLRPPPHAPGHLVGHRPARRPHADRERRRVRLVDPQRRHAARLRGAAHRRRGRPPENLTPR